MNTKIDRRDFLKNVAFGAAALSAAGLAPLKLLSPLAHAAGVGSSSPTGKRLLILNLAGGFDPVYVLQPDVGALADLRMPLFQSDLMPFNGQLGLTPSFPIFRELFDKGEALVMHRVGHLNLVREHATSERTNSRGTHDRLVNTKNGGWVERVADANPSSFTRLTDVVDLANGNSTVTGGKFAAASVNPSLQTFAAQSLPEVRALRDAKVFELGNVSIKTPLALEGSQGSLSAAALDEALRQAEDNDVKTRSAFSAQGTPLADYPNTRLGTTFKAVETVFGNLSTQVAYLRTDGFDTHFTQRDRIAQLFGGLNDNLTVFRKNLETRGVWKDTIILTTTDFGREFRMNSSSGTDHGIGADTFLIGPSVAGGRIIGEDYTAKDFEGKRFLDIQINVQNVLREVVGALGYNPEASFTAFPGQEKLGLFR